MSGLSKAEYLKKYMSAGTAEVKKKKKKPKPTSTSNGMLIVEEEAFASVASNAKPDVGSDEEEEIKIEAEIKKRVNSLGRFKSAFGAVEPVIKKEEPDSAPSSPPRTRRDSKSPPPPPSRRQDSSPPRQARSRRDDSDESPPRRRQRRDSDAPPHPQRARRDSDASPPRRRQRRDSDASPNRQRARKDSDASPPRRRQQLDSDSSPPRSRPQRDSDASPPRQRQRRDSDCSPPRRTRRGSDSSPPRRRPPPVDSSPKRKTKEEQASPSRDQSPPRRRRPGEQPETRRRIASPKMIKDEEEEEEGGSRTLDGKRAGLQSAKALREESETLRAKERKMFDDLATDISGRGAETVMRSKQTGRHREKPEDKEKKEREAKKQAELADKYALWNKGTAQLERRAEQLEEMARVAAEPLARAADDEAMNEHLRSVVDEKEDPMAKFVLAKRRNQDISSGRVVYPRYEGAFPPNRFNIPPGYRWDGVVRGNGFEERMVTAKNRTKAQEAEAYAVIQTYD